MKNAIAAILLLAAIPAFGHAMLASSTPADGAEVKSPHSIILHFSENLEPAFSGAELSDAAGKTVALSSAVSGTAITLLSFSLKPGAYKVHWHSVGRDTHRVTGTIAFTVLP